MSNKLEKAFQDAGLTPPSRALATELANALEHETKITPSKESVTELAALLKAKMAAEREHELALGFRRRMAQERAAVVDGTNWTMRRLKATFALVIPEVNLLGVSFWLSTTILMGLGIVLTTPQGVERGLVPLFLVAPLLAVLSVAYAFRFHNNAVAAWERSCPVSPVQLMLARLSLVVVYNIGLSVGGTLLVLLRGLSTPLPVVISGWLGPLLGLAGITLLVSLRFNNRVAAGVGLSVWLTYAIATDGGKMMLMAAPVLSAFFTVTGIILFIAAAALGQQYCSRHWQVPSYAD